MFKNWRETNFLFCLSSRLLHNVFCTSVVPEMLKKRMWERDDQLWRMFISSVTRGTKCFIGASKSVCLCCFVPQWNSVTCCCNPRPDPNAAFRQCVRCCWEHSIYTGGRKQSVTNSLRTETLESESWAGKRGVIMFLCIAGILIHGHAPFQAPPRHHNAALMSPFSFVSYLPSCFAVNKFYWSMKPRPLLFQLDKMAATSQHWKMIFGSFNSSFVVGVLASWRFRRLYSPVIESDHVLVFLKTICFLSGRFSGPAASGGSVTFVSAPAGTFVCSAVFPPSLCCVSLVCSRLQVKLCFLTFRPQTDRWSARTCIFSRQMNQTQWEFLFIWAFRVSFDPKCQKMEVWKGQFTKNQEEFLHMWSCSSVWMVFCRHS